MQDKRGPFQVNIVHFRVFQLDVDAFDDLDSALVFLLQGCSHLRPAPLIVVELGLTDP